MAKRRSQEWRESPSPPTDLPGCNRFSRIAMVRQISFAVKSSERANQTRDSSRNHTECLGNNTVLLILKLRKPRTFREAVCRISSAFAEKCAETKNLSRFAYRFIGQHRAIVSTTAPVMFVNYNVRNSIISTSASNFEYFFGRSIHFFVFFFLRLTWIFFCCFKFEFWERNGVRYQGFGTEQKYCSGISETVRFGVFSGILQIKFY